MKAYEKLLRTLGETDSTIFDEFLYETDNPKSFLNPSKILPSIGTRKFILRTKHSTDLSLVNLAEKRLIFQKKYELPENEKDLNHDFIEEIPLNWEFSNQYISSRINNEPFNEENSISRGLFDFINSIHEFSEYGFDPSLLSQFYFTCKKLFEKKKVKRKKVSDLLEILPKVDQVMKQEKKIQLFQKFVQIHKKKKKRKKLIEIMSNYNSFIIENHKRIYKKEEENDSFFFEKFKVETKKDLQNYFRFYLRSNKRTSTEWLENAVKHVWNTKIPNDKLRMSIIEQVKNLKNQTKNQIYIQIIRMFMDNDDFLNIQQHIQSIWIQENFKKEIENFYQFLKSISIHQWKLMNPNMIKHLIIQQFQQSELENLTKHLYIFNLFLPSNLKYKLKKRRAVEDNFLNLSFEFDQDRFINNSVFSELIQDCQQTKGIEELSNNHIVSFIFQFDMKIAIKIFPSLLKLFFISMKNLEKFQKRIYHQRMNEFLLIENYDEMTSFTIFKKFHSFIEMKYPLDYLILVALRKRKLKELSLLNLPNNFPIIKYFLDTLSEWYQFYKVFCKFNRINFQFIL
eukprot:gene4875-8469_t